MNFTKRALTAVASLCLLAAAPVALAIPLSLTSATIDLGTGYGDDVGQNGENGGKLLDVRFAEPSSAPQRFEFASGGASSTFDLGTVYFAETDSGKGANFGINKYEAGQADLDVSWTFIFANPFDDNQSMSATAKAKAKATATYGSIDDAAVDYALVWGDVNVDFGAHGQFLISLNDLAFSKTGTQTQTATITWLALPMLSRARVFQEVPEPASLALAGLALVGMAAMRRRKQASS